MESKSLKLFGLWVLAGLTGSVAHAVEPTVYQLGDGGAVAPHVRLEFGNDNNPLRANAGSQETMYLRLQPSVRYLIQRRNNRLSLGYSGDYYQYFEEYCRGQGDQVVRPGDCLRGSPTFDKASFQDHTLSLDGFLEISKRLRATLEIDQVLQHQPLGTGLSANRGVLNDLTTPDNWNRTTARAQLSYGAFQARGEIRAGLSVSRRDLSSVRSVNLDAQSDRSVAPYAQLLYRVGTRTQLFAGIGQEQVRDSISYFDDGTLDENLERDISRLSVGAELDPDSVTSGSVSISQVREDFLGTNRDLQFLGWDVSLVWRPRRYSTVTISGGRETESGVFEDDISLSTSLGANWVHFWRERFSTRAQFDFELNEDVDEFSSQSENSDAEDRTTWFRFEGNYNIRRWLDIGGFIVINSRDGRGDARDYERTVIGFTANGTI